ncbi:MAG: DNA-binding protein [Betaproteobacteria bacterium]|nr:DNA-binding protein [Betaproteobacteria bacterium]
MGITKEQIFALADKLDGDGQKATLALIRKQLGSGSFTTISEAMNEWRARKASRVSPIREPVPQSVTGKLSELGGELWAVSLEMANSRLASEREALETLRQETGAARQEAAELADQLATELEEAKTHITALEAAVVGMRCETDEIEVKLGAAQVEVSTAEARAGELRTALDYARQETRQARAERDRACEEAAVLRGRLEALESVMAPERSAAKGNPLEKKAG